MESRSYNFSTARKRSTLMENKVIYFPREDENAPRTRILMKECPQEYGVFRECLEKFKEESKCRDQKDSMIECGKPAFRIVNTNRDYEY